jgi:hypothetical protein
MCPICILSAIVLGTSAASAGGLNWLKSKLGGGRENRTGEFCRLFPQCESEAAEQLMQPPKT